LEKKKICQPKEKKKKNLIDSSCPTNKCLHGGQCSTRLGGNFHCECLNGYEGINCENGFFFFQNL